MNKELGYPYSYGNIEDSESAKQIKLSRTVVISIVVITALTSVPLFANAVLNETLAMALLDKITTLETEIKALDGKTCGNGISVTSAAACIVSGFCMAHAKKAIVSGNVAVAGGLICASATSICAERIARAKGYTF